jgi:hypothetical protein
MKHYFYCIFPLLFVFPAKSQEGESVKYEIFHVDLVPASFLYGVAELAWSLAMYDALDKTYAAQQEIDSLFKKLVILETKTQDYQKNLQAGILQSLNPNYVDKMVSDMHDNQRWMDEYVVVYPEYAELVKEVQKKITDRADRIKRYIDNAAKKTGNTGRLDNRQRNDLNLYVLEELMKLKSVSHSIRSELFIVNPEISKMLIPITE